MKNKWLAAPYTVWMIIFIILPLILVGFEAIIPLVKNYKLCYNRYNNRKTKYFGGKYEIQGVFFQKYKC